MEGRKNDRPAWINNVFDHLLKDFKVDRDPTVNLKAVINDLENSRIDPELLKIRVKLTKDPVDYAVNNPNKKIGMLLGAKAGDVIWYYKTDHDKKRGSVSIYLQEISISKYKEMLTATVKNSLEILDYGSAEKNRIRDLWYCAEIKEEENKHKIKSETVKISSDSGELSPSQTEDVFIQSSRGLKYTLTSTGMGFQALKEARIEYGNANSKLWHIKEGGS